MKLFLSPYKPITYLLPLAALCLIAPLGRFYAGDGTVWTLLGGVGLFALFAVAATNWEAADQLGSSFTRWMNSAVLTMLVGSGVLALATAASSVINQIRNPYYQGYDLFLITNNEPVEWLTSHPFADSDFVPEPYWVENAGQSIVTIAMTLLLTLTFYMLCCVGGLALGLTLRHQVGFIVPAAAVIALVAYAFTYTMLAIPYTAEGAMPGQNAYIFVPLREPWAVAIAAGSIAGLIILITSVYVIARTPRLKP